MDASRLLTLTPEIRLLICDHLIDDAHSYCYQHLSHDQIARGKTTANTKRVVTQARRNILLVCRQFHHELAPVWFRRTVWQRPLCHAYLGPQLPLGDGVTDRCVYQHARVYWLDACPSFSPGGPEYSVRITVLPYQSPGYRLMWEHLSDANKQREGVDHAMYETVVNRVTAHVAAMVAARHAADGVYGLTWEGMEKVVAALYLSDLIYATPTWFPLAAAGADDAAGGDAAVWVPDTVGPDPAYYW
ncbi:hypothetical protein LTR53_013251 [Teratosphaeriaceae sp. CCFEE 6253]|nr:hypothetical protein LTR53_013251 [Teratosphaeriaceae sp. CCFEE 6253]